LKSGARYETPTHARIPAINKEMTWSERPAQPRSAALRVLKPRPLMKGPEKMGRIPLGTEETNMAQYNNKALDA